MSEFTSKAYFEALKEGRIRASKCSKCEAIYLPPRSICTKCGADKMDWVDLEKTGEITAYTIIEVPLSKMIEKCPYAVAVVRLNSGPSISGQVLVDDHSRVAIGSRVMAEFVEEDGLTSLCFKMT